MSAFNGYPVLQGFIDLGGTIDIGRFGTGGVAAVAADERVVWVALAHREGESFHRLMDRLERTLARCLACQQQVDELGEGCIAA